MKVVLIPGDGIGKEIAQSVLEISKQLPSNIEWLIYEAGAEYYEKTGKLFEDGLFEAIQENRIALKGPTATPIGKGFSSINVQLRKEFNTYANIRPIHSLPSIQTPYKDVDLVIFRENTEDLYSGIEEKISEDEIHGIKVITRSASEKIIRAAFEYAIKEDRKKVTAVHKANIMKQADGLFLEVFEEVSKEYPTIEKEMVIVDACCMKLVMNPNQFDVIVTMNLYGDILSDLCAGLVGGLGFAPSVNQGEEIAIYEAVHGSAPDIAGKNLANPTALLMALEMLLKDQGYLEDAYLLEKALSSVMEEGKVLTKDMGGTSSTTEYTNAIIERIQHENH